MIYRKQCAHETWYPTIDYKTHV